MNFLALQQLPEEVKDIIFSDQSVDVNTSIGEDFKLSSSELKAVLEIVLEVFTSEITPLELPSALAKLNLHCDVRVLALTLAEKRLWPLRKFYPGVDLLISRLGGSVPSDNSPSTVASSRDNNDMVATAQEFLDQANDHRYLWLTSVPMKNAIGQPVEPTIEEWLRDFLRHMGPMMNDGLARSQYLVRSPNAQALTSDDKETLLNFISSYGENTLLSFHPEGKFLKINPLNVPGTDNQPKRGPQAVNKVAEIAARYQTEVEHLRTTIEGLRAGIEVEIAGQTGRLGDIVWNALGLGEFDRVVVALSLLAEKQLLGELISKDLRFAGIIRRYISVRFGEQAKSHWQANNSLVSLLLFLQLVLQEKLGLSAEQAAMTGQYIVRLAKLDSVAYIDLVRAEFRFREVKYSGNEFKIEGK